MKTFLQKSSQKQLFAKNTRKKPGIDFLKFFH